MRDHQHKTKMHCRMMARQETPEPEEHDQEIPEENLPNLGKDTIKPDLCY